MLLHLLQLLVLFLTVVVALWYGWYFKFYRWLKCFPRLKVVPFFGCAMQFPSTTAAYTTLFAMRKKLGPTFWSLVGIEPFLFTSDPKLIGIILSSTKFIDKSKTYCFLHSWLGLGLLTSTGERWKKHRKILTPAFHFKILEEFAERFDSASNILVQKLSEEVGKSSTDISPYITACSLDIICESTMGISVDAQLNPENHYVKSVKEITKIIIDRTVKPILNLDFTYVLTETYQTERKIVKYMHDFTDNVIRQRRILFSQMNNAEPKKKLAFLDLLLNYSQTDREFTDSDIRQEVDTFMFEGHDTTSAAVNFALYLLANNPKEQENTFSEIKSILGDKFKIASFQDFQEMKYLELVIKETLRLYPSVPVYARELKEDLKQDGFRLPKGLTVLMGPYVMHRDANLFPDPDAFKPERHLVDNISEKTSFDYIPFSAGPRNCIGQKFAMLSMKSTISKVLRNFELLPVEHKMELALETILKSKNGVMLKLKNRQW